MFTIEREHEKIDIHFKWDVSKLTTYEKYARALLCLKVEEHEQRSIALDNFSIGTDFSNFEFAWEIFRSNELFAKVLNKSLFITHCLSEFFNPDGEEVNTTFFGHICNDMFNMLSNEQKNIVIERILNVEFFDFHTSDLDIINNSYFPSAILEYMSNEQLDKLCSLYIYPIHNDIVYTAKMSYTTNGEKRQYLLNTVAN
jgi:hypothetical protein